MTTTVKILAIVDLEGHVVAAQLADQANDSQTEEAPSASLMPMKGQRVISIEVPQEVLEFRGFDLHFFFSSLEISWPADVQVPKIEIVRKGRNNLSTGGTKSTTIKK